MNYDKDFWFDLDFNKDLEREEGRVPYKRRVLHSSMLGGILCFIFFLLLLLLF